MKYIRTHQIIVTYSLYLYFNSRSYKCASRSLKHITKRSHVSIWKWMQKHAADVVDWFGPNSNQVKMIFVCRWNINSDRWQEELITGHGLHMNLTWICVWWCTYIYIYIKKKNYFICYQFFKEIQKRFGRKPIFTDSARWYIMILVNG